MFFGFIVYAYGSQLKNTFENQLLSSIYSEYNNCLLYTSDAADEL